MTRPPLKLIWRTLSGSLLPERAQRTQFDWSIVCRVFAMHRFMTSP